MTPFGGLERIEKPPEHLTSYGNIRYSDDWERTIMDYLGPDGTLYRRIEERGYSITWYIVR